MSRIKIMEGICKSCKKLFSREQFYINKKGYLQAKICKKCRISFLRKTYKDKGRQKEFYRKFLKESCEKCGFKGLKCQLDIDHNNKNRQDNTPSNLITLCANCHRLKTHHPELF